MDELNKDLKNNEVKENENLENSEKKVMKFQDEEGNVFELEIVAVIFLEDNEYNILSPLEEGEDEYLYKVIRDEDGNIKEFNSIEDDSEFLKVKKEYSKLLYEEK